MCIRDSSHTFAELLQQGAIKEGIDTLFMGFTEAEAVKPVSYTHLYLLTSPGSESPSASGAVALSIGS